MWYACSALTVNDIVHKTHYAGPSRRGVEGVKGPGPVNIMCHSIYLL